MKNENYDFINYISNNNFDAVSVSAINSSHVISNQLLFYFMIDHSDFFHDISD